MWESKEVFLSFFLGLHVVQAAAIGNLHQSRIDIATAVDGSPFFSTTDSSSVVQSLLHNTTLLSNISAVAPATRSAMTSTMASAPSVVIVSSSTILSADSVASLPLNQTAFVRTPVPSPSTAFTSSLLPSRSLPAIVSELLGLEVSSIISELLPSSLETPIPSSILPEASITAVYTSSPAASLPSVNSTSTSSPSSTSSTQVSSSSLSSSLSASLTFATAVSSASSVSASKTLSISSASTATSAPASTATIPPSAVQKSTSNSLSQSQLAGAISGSILGSAALLLALLYLWRRRNTRADESRTQEQLEGATRFHGGPESAFPQSAWLYDPPVSPTPAFASPNFLMVAQEMPVRQEEAAITPLQPLGSHPRAQMGMQESVEAIGVRPSEMMSSSALVQASRAAMKPNTLPNTVLLSTAIPSGPSIRRDGSRSRSTSRPSRPVSRTGLYEQETGNLFANGTTSRHDSGTRLRVVNEGGGWKGKVDSWIRPRSGVFELEAAVPGSAI